MTQTLLKRWVPFLLGALLLLGLVALTACAGPTPTPEPTAIPTEAPALTLTEAAPENNPPLVRIKILGELEGIVDEEGEPFKTSALSNVGVDTYVFLQEVASDPDEGDSVTTEWEFTPAEGSSAELVEAGSVYFIADVEGRYEVKLIATDTKGASGEAILTVNAGTYLGQENCAMCHADQAETQAETGHATIFAGGIDGTVSDHYAERCISCHTVGPWEGENGAFDDVMAEVGWTFPETLQEGNWEALQADFPELAALGNIQCENCHGPGSDHMGDPLGIATSLDAAVCGTCQMHLPTTSRTCNGSSRPTPRRRLVLSRILSAKTMRPA